MSNNKSVLIIAILLVGFLIAGGHINLQPLSSTPDPTAKPAGSYGGGGTATIKTSSPELSIYSDESEMSPVTSIDWGALSPNQTKTVSIYLLSDSDYSHVTASRSNLDPASIKDFTDFQYSNSISLAANQLKQFNLTLRIHPDIANITAFSFNIMINVYN